MFDGLESLEAAKFTGGDRMIEARVPSVPGAFAAVDRRARWMRQASLATKVGWASRLLAIGVRVVTIPIALRLLGTDRYGLWLSVGSALAWVGLVGPGLGHGLINALADAAGRDDASSMRRHVSTAVCTVGGLGLVLLALSPMLSAWSGWPLALGVATRPDLTAEAVHLIGVASVLFALSVTVEVIGPVCLGLQEGHLSGFASMGGNLAVLVGVALLGWYGGSLIAFTLVIGLPPILANVMLGAYVLVQRHPQLRPSLRQWNTSSFALVLGFGGWMFLGTLGELAVYQSANVLIANRFGPGEVPRYAVPAALFLNVATLCYLIIQPYWPALKEASVRRDWEWIRQFSTRTFGTRMGIMAGASIALVTGGPALIHAWAGPDAVPPRSLLLAMSAYSLLVAWTGSYVVLLLALGFVKVKTLLTVLVGATHIAGFFVLSPYLGLSAIPVGGAVGVLTDGLVASWIASRYMRAQEQSLP